jgi:hypothetical protein
LYRTCPDSYTQLLLDEVFVARSMAAQILREQSTSKRSCRALRDATSCANTRRETSVVAQRGASSAPQLNPTSRTQTTVYLAFPDMSSVNHYCAFMVQLPDVAVFMLDNPLVTAIQHLSVALVFYTDVRRMTVELGVVAVERLISSYRLGCLSWSTKTRVRRSPSAWH